VVELSDCVRAAVAHRGKLSKPHDSGGASSGSRQWVLPAFTWVQISAEKKARQQIDAQLTAFS